MAEMLVLLEIDPDERATGPQHHPAGTTLDADGFPVQAGVAACGAEGWLFAMAELLEQRGWCQACLALMEKAA